MRQPWVGDAFSGSGLLVLGESHYGYASEIDDLAITQDVVRRVVAGTRVRFFTSVERVITGCIEGGTKPDVFWPTVAFANFCPGLAPDGNRKPTPEMWAEGVRRFPDLLTSIKPARMLIVGKGVWDHTGKVEGFWEEGEPLCANGYKQPAGWFLTPDRLVKVYATYIYHPASSYWGGPERWMGLAREFMRRNPADGMPKIE